VVNLAQLDGLPTDAPVTIEALRKARLVRKKNLPVKILGRGTLTKPLQVQANAFSASAKAAIEAAGGSAVEV
jgi:large subunit ribosomal protein L15